MKSISVKIFFIATLLNIFFVSCKNTQSIKIKTTELCPDHQQLFALLEDNSLKAESRFALVNKIAQAYVTAKRNTDLILFLTDYVKKNPNDRYNSYWLLMTAYAYQSNNADEVAKLYYERIIRNYNDLSINGKSIHFLCLQKLVQLSDDSVNSIDYFNQLITHFPQDVSKTELYIRLAKEYEKLGEWNQALKSYSLFLSQKDAATIQIAGIPDAYEQAKNLIDFNNSPKDWTFESLEDLEFAIKRAILWHQYTKLDTFKSKVNFFAMSWKQDIEDKNSQETFSMRDYGGQQRIRIRYSAELDESSNPNEAYLRTWGWSNYISVWYFYFRKVNFPIDPEIHGRWEWAGIYFGEKL